MTKATLAALSVLTFSVSASADMWKKIEGQHSGIRERRAVAVADEAAWEKIWKEHAASAPAPAVDFSKESVVAVFLGETSAAGVTVEVVVSDDRMDGNRLNVFYKEVRSPRAFAASVICTPFAIVKVRKTATVSFEVNVGLSIPEKAAAHANPRDTTKFRALLETMPFPSFDGR